jgi:hypothetical protein
MKRKALIKVIDLIGKTNKCIKMGGMSRRGIVDNNKMLK